MLRVAEHYAATDTGRQRRANEDSMLARSPLFVVADGMGGAQAGEVASSIAIEAFSEPVEDFSDPALALTSQAQRANERIHERSHSDASYAGMGTTVTAAYVGERDVTVAHVGDSRAYRMRAGELTRLTDDHSLVDELIRQGRLTPEEAEDHPQRSIITRALGPEASVEVDTRVVAAAAGDLYMLCSDGLTSMVPEQALAEILDAHPRLRDAGEALIDAANRAGGKDNITVVLLRLEEVALAGEPGQERGEHPTLVSEAVPKDAEPAAGGAQPAAGGAQPAAGGGEPATRGGDAVMTAAPPEAVVRRLPRRPPERALPAPASRRRMRRAVLPLSALTVLCIIAAGAYLALQSVYFIGTNSNGMVTIYNGVPYVLPGGLHLYTTEYVSGVGASTLSPSRRRSLLDHSLRSEKNAGELVRKLELGQLSGGGPRA